MAQSDTIHLQLLSTCLLCQHDIYEGESITLTFGDPLTSKFWGCTSTFKFPRWSPYPEVIIIPTAIRPSSGALCRVLRCDSCFSGPETFVFHIACFKFLQGMHHDLTPEQLWRIGTWLRPLPKRCSNLVAPSSLHEPASLQKLISSIPTPPSTSNNVTEFKSLFKHLSLLPSELQSTVYSNSSNAFLWRFAFVLDFEKIFLNFGKGNTITRLLPLRRWIRGMRLEEPADKLSAKDIVRLGLDDRGIKTCQVIEDTGIPEVASCSWYIILRTTSVQALALENSGGLLRLCASVFVGRQVRYWDCSNPPDLSACRIIGDVTYSNRLRCTNLDAIFGVTIFTANGWTYGIHAHTSNSPSAFETYLKFPTRRAKDLLWMYFPLCHSENISSVRLRHRPDEHGELSSPILMLRTTRDRECIFGQYMSPGTEGVLTEPIGKGIPIQLIYNDPEPGRPIVLFGATYNMTQRSQSISTPLFSHPPALPSVHLSHATLERVVAVSIFIEEETEYCLGLLLKYQDGLQECLGQCRLGLDTKITVASPTALHICHFDHGEMHYSVRVKVSTATSSADIDESEWKTTTMRDHIVWWFNDYSNIVTIESDDHY